MSNIQEFDNLIKENQNKAKELNIGSNKVVLEMNEDTTKYVAKCVATAPYLKLGDQQLRRRKKYQFL